VVERSRLVKLTHFGKVPGEIVGRH
jgi:hypothetical protein